MRPTFASQPAADYRLAVVEAIDADKGIASVRDSFGARFEVTLRFLSGRVPEAGESWVLDRSMGFWRFHSCYDLPA